MPRSAAKDVIFFYVFIWSCNLSLRYLKVSRWQDRFLFTDSVINQSYAQWERWHDSFLEWRMLKYIWNSCTLCCTLSIQFYSLTLFCLVPDVRCHCLSRGCHMEPKLFNNFTPHETPIWCSSAITVTTCAICTFYWACRVPFEREFPSFTRLNALSNKNVFFFYILSAYKCNRMVLV